MKTIKIKFVDFYPGFDPRGDVVTRILKKRYQVEFSDEPEYLVYSCFGNDHLKYTNCIKICEIGENIAPDFNLCDYAVAQERMEYGDRYFWRPTGIELAARKELYHRENREVEGRPHFCSFVYSNGEADPMREQLYQAINSYKHVDSGGKLHHDIDIPQVEGMNQFEERMLFEKQFKFSIACENSSHPGYVTEKILVSFLAGTIPIYWGDPTIKMFCNEKAFINVSDYNNLDEVIQAVRRIDTDENLYADMIRQPVFVDGWDYEAFEKQFEAFVLHIFDQPKEKAYRRNLILRGKSYDVLLNEWHEAWEKQKAAPWWKFWKR